MYPGAGEDNSLRGDAGEEKPICDKSLEAGTTTFCRTPTFDLMPNNFNDFSGLPSDLKGLVITRRLDLHHSKRLLDMIHSEDANEHVYLLTWATNSNSQRMRAIALEVKALGTRLTWLVPLEYPSYPNNLPPTLNSTVPPPYCRRVK